MKYERKIIGTDEGYIIPKKEFDATLQKAIKELQDKKIITFDETNGVVEINYLNKEESFVELIEEGIMKENKEIKVQKIYITIEKFQEITGLELQYFSTEIGTMRKNKIEPKNMAVMEFFEMKGEKLYYSIKDNKSWRNYSDAVCEIE